MSRSYLFIPGNTPSMIQNLDVFESDAIIIDLEDSVSIHDKDAARDLVCNFLNKYQFDNFEIYVRVNDVETSFFNEDITHLNNTAINGFVLPKASSNAVTKLASITNKSIIPIIETPMAVLHMEEIASLPQVKGLLLGAEDLTKELQIERTTNGMEILYTRSKMVLVCRAYNIDSIDTPFTKKDTDTELEMDTSNAKNLGFTAKSSIHPNHIKLINQIFSPSKEEIYQAKRIVKKAEVENKGAFSLDGKMIDLPVIERAKKVLEKAAKYNLL